MVNFYTSQYRGRSCLIEFPSDGNELKITQECKRALKKLTNLSNQSLLNEADSFDQVVHLMRKHVKGYDVFLAIDNVWENSREQVERLLGVGFSATSKILLTSRSEQVLQDLLIEHTNTSYIGPLPTPKSEEAFQIFRKTFKLGDLSCLVDRNQIDRILDRCRFSGNYHALALKSLAQHAKQVCVLGDLEKIEHHLSLIPKRIGNADMQNLEDVIRLNYEQLPQHKKHMFLDIAVLLGQRVLLENAYAEVHQWLGFLYKKFPESEITRLIYELALDGLIQIEANKDGARKMIEVHDLFLDLAQREAANSSRFFTMKSTKSVEEIEWEKLERVIMWSHEDLHFFENLQQRECRKLQVLVVDCGIHLCFMPSLCVLILKDVKNGSVLNLNGLVQLQILRVDICNFVRRITGLDALQNLQTLYINGCPCLMNLDGLSRLIRLEALDVSLCESLKKMPDLSGLTCLKRLQLSENGSMDEVGCLSSALKDVRVEDCGALKKMPDLSGLTCLKSLQLSSNESMEEVGCLSSAVEDVRVDVCWALKKMPDMSGLTRLERLELTCNGSMEEVGGEYLSSTLKHLSIYGCERLRRLPSLDDCVHLQTLGACQIMKSSLLEKLANLHALELRDCDWNSNLLNDQWKHLTCLQDLIIIRCGSIQILEVGCLSSLKRLWVWEY